MDIITRARNQTLTKVAALSENNEVSSWTANITRHRKVNIACSLAAEACSQLPLTVLTLQRHKSHPVLMSSVPRWSGEGCENTDEKKKKSCMQKLHTLNIESGFSFPPAALAFLTLSLYLILICKHWRKERTEKNTPPLKMSLNKALCHIAAFWLSCKKLGKKKNPPLLLCFPSPPL